MNVSGRDHIVVEIRTQSVAFVGSADDCIAFTEQGTSERDYYVIFAPLQSVSYSYRKVVHRVSLVPRERITAQTKARRHK